MQWETFGHQSAKGILDQQLQSGRFAHAYLFLGPEGIGKKSLALEFAKKILGTERLENHADFSLLEPDGQISIEQAREFASALSFKPFMGRFKISVVNNAENLNTQSSNALLKTLEEPSPSTILILISQKPLMKTIMSRCQILNFNGFSARQLEEFASKKGLKAGEKELAMSFGSISSLLRLSSDPEFLAGQEQSIGKFTRLVSSSLAEKLLAINELAEQENGQLRQTFLLWLNWQLAKKPQAHKVLSALNQAVSDIATTKNKKLIIQSLFLKI
jgi:DNA polymerase-3 subunit delta'